MKALKQAPTHAQKSKYRYVGSAIGYVFLVNSDGVDEVTYPQVKHVRLRSSDLSYINAI